MRPVYGLLILAAIVIAGIAFVSSGPPREAVAGPSVAKVPANVASGVALEVFAKGFERPVLLTYAPRDRVPRRFVVEKTGRIRTVSKDGTVAKEPFLDLSARVSGASEQGLLGLAFHAGWATNGRMVVNYTDLSGDTRVVEFTVSSSGSAVANVVGERLLLAVDQPYSNHNGGNVIFGPDGKLWVGLGDGGWAGDPHGNGQNRKALLAKMLRIDAEVPDPEPEIVHIGWRNPWRYSFDRKTGDLYVADVGQDRYEEVNVVPAASVGTGNFGWNLVEGIGHCFEPKKGCEQAGLLQPVLEYGHGDGCSITGGFVYRGKALPALEGTYFYADYCTAIVRSFRWKGAASGGKVAAKVEDSWSWREALDPKERLSLLTSFGEDEEGELYLLSLDGTVWKFVPRR